MNMEKFSKIRTELGMTQKQVADILGKDPSVIKDYKMGISPSSKTLCKISDILQVTSQYLLDMYDNEIEDILKQLLLTPKEIKIFSKYLSISQEKRNEFISLIQFLSKGE